MELYVLTGPNQIFVVFGLDLKFWRQSERPLSWAMVEAKNSVAAVLVEILQVSRVQEFFVSTF